MNLRAFAGYYFFAAANATERANLFSSWGLLDDAPDLEPPTFFKRLTDWFWEFF